VDRLAYIGCDYLKSGRTAGGILGLFTGGNAKVGVVIGSPFVLGHRQRAQGFYQVIEQEFKGISVIGEVQNNDSEEISYQVVKKIPRRKSGGQCPVLHNGWCQGRHEGRTRTEKAR
jgi:LacI family transcriptional regulator